MGIHFKEILFILLWTMLSLFVIWMVVGLISLLKLPEDIYERRTEMQPEELEVKEVSIEVKRGTDVIEYPVED